jgi:hypothetical protein
VHTSPAFCPRNAEQLVVKRMSSRPALIGCGDSRRALLKKPWQGCAAPAERSAGAAPDRKQARTLLGRVKDGLGGEGGEEPRTGRVIVGRIGVQLDSGMLLREAQEGEVLFRW